MANYSMEALDQLRRETDLPALVRWKGIELTWHGQDLIGCCPFHQPTESSLVLCREDGIWRWRCRGPCETGGDSIEWIMRTEGVSFRHAIEVLHESDILSVIIPDRIVPQTRQRRLVSPLEASTDEATMREQVVNYYHETLKRTPAALTWLEKRGLTSGPALTEFRLGFADRTLGLRIPGTAWKAGHEVRSRLRQIGLIRDSGHEHFNGCLVFPIADEHGLITGMYGRKINDNLRPGTAMHIHLHGPQRGIWNPRALSADEVILCKSIIDALTFWVNGFRNVTASHGLDGFTPEMLRAFVEKGVRVVCIAFDRNEAGDTAADALAGRLIKAGMECRRVLFPRDMDANTFALEMPPAEKNLARAVRSARWIGNGQPRHDVHRLNTHLETPLITDSTDSPDVGEETSMDNAAENPEDQLPGPLAVMAGPARSLSARNDSGENIDEHTPSPLCGDTVPAAGGGGSEFIGMTFDNRVYRVLGLNKNTAYGVMKVNIRTMIGNTYHIDTLDLYSSRSRTSFIQAAAHETGVGEDAIKADLGAVLLKLEELQEAHIREITKPRKKDVGINDEDRREALSLLRKPDLLDCIVRDFDRCGVVGERTNKLIAYLACVSRYLARPLGIIIQSSSAAGKSCLMEAVLSFLPGEYWKKYSAVTGQSLFYMAETDLRNKVLAIVEEEGAERARYPLRILQSEGELTIASTGKDPTTGKLVSHTYRIVGPVAIIVSTSHVELDEDLQNRCLILTIDEDREQTRAIHQMQRELETLEGHRARREWDHIRTVHQNAQRLLRPLTVINPWARSLTFLDTRTRTRRDHVKYLTLINSIALLHQYQRTVKTDVYKGKPCQYIEVTLEDIETANNLAGEVLGRSLDELLPRTRLFLDILDGYVTTECNARNVTRDNFRFSRHDVHAAMGWSYDQVRTHLDRLVDLEYVLIHRGGRGQPFAYEMLYDGRGQDGKPFLTGLIDVNTLRHARHSTLSDDLGS